MNVWLTWQWRTLFCFLVSDAAWFDSTSALDSECDDEFYSVYDGMSVFPPSPPKFGVSEVLIDSPRPQFWLQCRGFWGCQGSHRCKFGGSVNFLRCLPSQHDHIGCICLRFPTISRNATKPRPQLQFKTFRLSWGWRVIILEIRGNCRQMWMQLQLCCGWRLWKP